MKPMSAKDYRARAMGYYRRALGRTKPATINWNWMDSGVTGNMNTETITSNAWEPFRAYTATDHFRLVERACAALVPGKQRKSAADWQQMKLRAHQAAARTVGK